MNRKRSGVKGTIFSNIHYHSGLFLRFMLTTRRPKRNWVTDIDSKRWSSTSVRASSAPYHGVAQAVGDDEVRYGEAVVLGEARCSWTEDSAMCSCSGRWRLSERDPETVGLLVRQSISRGAGYENIANARNAARS